MTIPIATIGSASPISSISSATPGVLALLVAVAVAMAVLLAVLAIAVTTGVGRLGRLGADRAAAGERCPSGMPSVAMGGTPPPPGPGADAGAGAGAGADPASDHARWCSDPWREAGRRLTTASAPAAR